MGSSQSRQMILRLSFPQTSCLGFFSLYFGKESFNPSFHLSWPLIILADVRQ
ncbi:hypothetical protein CSUI_007951 [Cystoisospora suis]|uniref:Uncharacterized protein n=1 Tax=Cystoisospora suis TaxID=483139 RepID=A0A2C6KPB5_9APIC|nr:hypothetical protein CSUI_007951 [Cystoisospora suis]